VLAGKGRDVDGLQLRVGLPCSFQAPPTYGDCASALGYRIVEGSFDGVTLDGLRWVLAAYWPGPLHELNGHGLVYLDSDATDRRNG
jgi:hypothetical protein